MRAQVQRVNGFKTGGHPVRRRNVRIPCTIPTRVDTWEGSMRGVCTDLSLGGMLFIGPSVPVGEKVSVTLELSSSATLRLLGEVLGHRIDPDRVGMAIRFPALSQNDLQEINRFVARQLA